MTIRNTARIASFFAAAALVAGAAVPASASFDPDAAATGKAAKTELSRAALNMKWCVKPSNGAADAKAVCKTRAKWIAEGKDPFGQN